MKPDRQIEVDIASLGARGDGIAEASGGRLFVPFAAPGDRLRVRPANKKSDRASADIVERLSDGPDRCTPVCRHFTVCGGCAVQHVAQAAYRDWKRSIVCEALSHRGIDTATVGSLIPGGLGRRRRARLRVRRTAGGLVLGFLAPRSHQIVPLSECPVLAPEIAGLFDPLRSLLGRLLRAGQAGEVAITLCNTGLDVIVATPDALDLAAHEALAAFADVQDLARLSWQSFAKGKPGAIEPVVRRRSADMQFGGVVAEIPPDAFVQPTAEGEAALRDEVLAGLAGAGRVADLYAGCGAFALPLAATGIHVVAMDSAADHIAALDAAARRNGLGEFVAAEQRDLERRPLANDTLRTLDGVVLDPPRAGAAAQCRLMAESAVPVIVYVSCNPASFARDARTLIDGGYGLETITPVDQFLYSAHVELVGVFRKIG